MSFDRAQLARAVQSLAAQNVFIGTSSWKYRGWFGMLYDESRYIFRGRFSETRFKDNCLAEYSEVFKTVCVDAAYYKFPDHHYLESMISAVPADFQFAFKITDEITIKKFPDLPRFGPRAGKPNDHYLDANLFTEQFIAPCEPFRKQMGLLIFEFSKFYPTDYEFGREFVADLDTFLTRLPRGWPYAIEIRNRHFLHPDYFATLARHSVAHVFNSWTDMPPVHEQLALAGSRTVSTLTAARFLLRPGRKYEDSVKLFEPYDKLKDPYPEARAAGAALIKQARAGAPRPRTYIYVNNRLEGNSLETINAMIDEAGQETIGHPDS